jgi:hypothetical protein
MGTVFTRGMEKADGNRLGAILDSAFFPLIESSVRSDSTIRKTADGTIRGGFGKC